MEYIKKVCGVTEREISSLMRWVAAQGIVNQVEAVKIQGDLSNKYRVIHYGRDKRPEFFYAMLIMAIKKMKYDDSSIRQKIKISSETSKKLTEQRRGKIKAIRVRGKPAAKFELIKMRFFEEIKAHLEAGMSWREIEDYIKIYHRVQMSHSYLQQVYNKITKELTSVSKS